MFRQNVLKKSPADTETPVTFISKLFAEWSVCVCVCMFE